MVSSLKNCWEICDCGRQANGEKVNILGECVASKEHMGHSCWALAGTLGCNKVQGSAEEKELICMGCQVYKLYNRAIGTERKYVTELYPEEDLKYSKHVLDSMSEQYRFFSNYGEWALRKTK